MRQFPFIQFFLDGSPPRKEKTALADPIGIAIDLEPRSTSGSASVPAAAILPCVGVRNGNEGPGPRGGARNRVGIWPGPSGR